MRNRAFDEPMDGIVYGVVASLGFATLENILFVFNGGMSVAVSRAFTAVPLHAFVGAIMGYYVGQAWRHPEERRRYILQGYGIAVLLHMLYDFPLMAMAEVEEVGTVLLLGLCTLGVLMVCWLWTVRLVRRLRREQLALVVPSVIAEAGVTASDPTGSPVPPAEGESAGAHVPAAPPANRSQQVRIRQRIAGIAICIVGGLVRILRRDGDAGTAAGVHDRCGAADPYGGCGDRRRA